MDRLIELIVTLAVVGLVLWIILAVVPLPPPFGTVLVAIVCLAAVLYLFRGAWPPRS